MTGRLLLIASYPKSGNTWVRLMFAALTAPAGRPFSINDLDSGLQGLALRALFDSLAPAKASNLSMTEIDSLLPDVYVQLVADNAGRFPVKVHECARRTLEGRWIFPPEIVSAAVYVVRHPFDVAVSFAHHFGQTVEQAVGMMCDDDLVVSEPLRRLPAPLHQVLGSWSRNVLSWAEGAPYPVTLARYEDMFADPKREFARLARAMGLESTQTRIEMAVEATRFDRLQREERERGFHLRPPTADAPFFRSGRPGASQGELDRDSKRRLAEKFGPVMRRFGYGEDGGTVPMPKP